MTTLLIIGGGLGVSIGMILIADGKMPVGITIFALGVLELVLGVKRKNKDSKPN